MNLSAISISRPVLATVCSMVLVLFGVVAFFLLGVREYPAVDPPIITVTANYAGASPTVIASQITEPLEQQINGIDGIRVLSSTSSEERSQIRVEFEVGADLEAAANDVRDRVSRAVRLLPPDADPPVVEKSDADSDPIIFLGVQSPTRSILEVNDFADRVVRERLRAGPRAALSEREGARRRAVRRRRRWALAEGHVAAAADVELSAADAARRAAASARADANARARRAAARPRADAISFRRKRRIF